MKINVSQLRKEMGMSESFSFQENLTDDFLPKHCHLTGPVEVTGTVTNSGDSILLKGKLQVPIKMQCTRCLAEYEDVLCSKMEEEYVDPMDERLEDNVAESTDQVFYSNHLIALDDLVQEMILLAIPMKPLCEPSCKGLCAQCGQDLNEKDCNCITDQIDIRLDALKSLLEKQD